MEPRVSPHPSLLEVWAPNWLIGPDRQMQAHGAGGVSFSLGPVSSRVCIPGKCWDMQPGSSRSSVSRAQLWLGGMSLCLPPRPSLVSF